jgi:hypothetical protein
MNDILQDSEVMDGALRLFAEDCDNMQVRKSKSLTTTADLGMQGVQILNDTTTFGGFMDGFFTHFRDEYNKLPSITFPTSTIGFQEALSVENVSSSISGKPKI